MNIPSVILSYRTIKIEPVTPPPVHTTNITSLKRLIDRGERTLTDQTLAEWLTSFVESGSEYTIVGWLKGV